MWPDWVELSSDGYHKMLEILPPAYQCSYGFLMGEPFDYHYCKVTGDFLLSYASFVNTYERFYAGPYMTLPEFRKLDLSTIPQKKT